MRWLGFEISQAGFRSDVGLGKHGTTHGFGLQNFKVPTFWVPKCQVAYRITVHNYMCICMCMCIYIYIHIYIYIYIYILYLCIGTFYLLSLGLQWLVQPSSAKFGKAHSTQLPPEGHARPPLWLDMEPCNHRGYDSKTSPLVSKNLGPWNENKKHVLFSKRAMPQSHAFHVVV